MATEEAIIQGKRQQLHLIIYRTITGEMLRKTATGTKYDFFLAWMFMYGKSPSLATDFREIIIKLPKKMYTEDCQYSEPLINNIFFSLKSTVSSYWFRRSPVQYQWEKCDEHSEGKYSKNNRNLKSSQ